MKIMLRMTIFILTCTLYPISCVLANNLTVSNVSLYKAPGQPAGTIGVKFDLNWDNSFTGVDSNGQAFFDRAWVFIKYFNAADPVNTPWSHATLISGGTVGDYSTQTGVGISANSDTGKKVGAFCKPGANQVLYWNYGATDGDGVPDTTSISVKVMAIEMVYVPTSSFYVGSGGNETYAFYRYPNPTDSYKITSEGAINVGTTAGNLYYPTGLYGGDQTGPIPAAFPKGYNGFYMMKYEITQGQYRDFLNTLSRTQQGARVWSDISGDAPASNNVYVMTATTVVNGRQGLRCPWSGNGTTNPITFSCDLNSNGIGNEATDGEWVSCTFLSWYDLCAYADWAGLRPMTELEFEKACRGPLFPVVNEYAWGSTSITASATGPTNSGANNEIATNSANNVCASGGIGPFRSGFAATSSSTRYAAGSSYYGIMELSGNSNERAVSVGTSAGRAFTGLHGDGVLTSGGSGNVLYWPDDSTSGGSGFRGGGFVTGLPTSNRTETARGYSGGHWYGESGRCVRTSP